MASRDHNNGNQRGPLIALAAIMLIVAAALLLVHELSASARLQDCVLSGRTNCAPIHVR